MNSGQWSVFVGYGFLVSWFHCVGRLHSANKGHLVFDCLERPLACAFKFRFYLVESGAWKSSRHNGENFRSKNRRATMEKTSCWLLHPIFLCCVYRRIDETSLYVYFHIDFRNKLENCYVTDSNQNRVSNFSPQKGKFLQMLSACCLLTSSWCELVVSNSSESIEQLGDTNERNQYQSKWKIRGKASTRCTFILIAGTIYPLVEPMNHTQHSAWKNEYVTQQKMFTNFVPFGPYFTSNHGGCHCGFEYVNTRN